MHADTNICLVEYLKKYRFIDIVRRKSEIRFGQTTQVNIKIVKNDRKKNSLVTYYQQRHKHKKMGKKHIRKYTPGNKTH